MRKYFKTLIAVAILVALWFGFTAWNKHKTSEQAASAAPARKLTDLTASQISSFTIEPRDGTSFTCEKHGNAWSITKPQTITADQGKISSFLQSLTSASADQVISPKPADLKNFGLDPPEETIQASAPGKTFTLRMGDETPTSSGVYAQTTDGPGVFTLSEDAKAALEKTMFDLRDTRAITLDTSKLQKIDAKWGSQKFSLVKNPDGDWDVDLPPGVRADRFTVEGLVGDLQGLTMQSVVSEQKKVQPNYGFAKPELTLALSTPEATQTLVVGAKGEQGYYAMNSALSPVFTLDEGSVTQFEKPASDLRDKSLFSWDMLDVKSLEITSPSGHWIFEHTGQQWRQTAPSAKSIPSEKADAFVSELRNLQAVSFPAAKPGELDKFGFSKPVYTFKVQYGSKNQTEVVELAQSGGHVYARRASDLLPSEISKTDLATIENLLKQM